MHIHTIYVGTDGKVTHSVRMHRHDELLLKLMVRFSVVVCFLLAVGFGVATAHAVYDGSMFENIGNLGLSIAAVGFFLMGLRLRQVQLPTAQPKQAPPQNAVNQRRPDNRINQNQPQRPRCRKCGAKTFDTGRCKNIVCPTNGLRTTQTASR